MKSVMKHQFSQVPKADIPRSVFDRTHGYKTTFDAGYLIPFYADEALPGDTFNLNATIFARLATPIYPIMDNLFMDIHYFAVPLRLLWTNWKRFMGEQVTPGASTDFATPKVTSPGAGWATGTIADYFGIPILQTAVIQNAFHFRAYNLIYNQWYRDQNLIAPVPENMGDGPDLATDYVLQRRGKRHDYFTSALPWPQKGPGVNLPIGTVAPIIGIGKQDTTYALSNQPVNETAKASTQYYDSAADIGDLAAGNNFFVEQDVGAFVGRPAIYADLTNATAATINSIRQAFQLQKLYERDARGGTRYTEMVKAHFGVTSPDARLQRPEYLGGTSTAVGIAPVPSTYQLNATAPNRPQGSVGGFGVINVPGVGFTKSFTEHCVILGIASVRADLTYQQGLPRMFSRNTRFDFYWPGLSHLGEQAILNQEIYVNSNTTENAAVFGYQERWAEYRYFPSKITGKFRSTAATPLDAWHLSQNFTSRPTLSQTFIEETPPMARVIAVTTEPHFIFDSLISIKCTRPMPVYSVPGLIDHF